jgi:hypothetical protein
LWLLQLKFLQNPMSQLQSVVDKSTAQLCLGVIVAHVRMFFLSAPCKCTHINGHVSTGGAALANDVEALVETKTATLQLVAALLLRFSGASYGFFSGNPF